MPYHFPSIRLPRIQIRIEKDPALEVKNHFIHLIFESNKMMQSLGDDDQRQNEILKNTQKTGDLIGEVQSSRDITAVIQLWRNVDAFIVEFPVSQKLLTRFKAIRNQQGILALFFLTQLFLERFDDCGDVHALSQFLRKEFSSHASFKKNDALEKLRRKAPAVLSVKGPEKIVSYTMRDNCDLNAAIQTAGIPKEQSGKYLDVCKKYYYIKTLKLLNPGDESYIFYELTQGVVIRMPYHDKLLGHEVLSIMIQKGIDSGDVLPENWLQIILNIADDPRVSMRSEWWSLLLPKHIEAMQGWLAGFDLELFLQALSNYVDTSYDASLQRMFPARAKFLRGLYDHKLISRSKLFIGNAPRRYLERRYNHDQMPTFSILKHGDLSVIYLKVGDVHMVEGSHSFSLRLYDQLPDGGQFSFESRSKRFGDRELGIGLAEKYKRQFRKDAFSITHHPSPTWQHKIIQELEKQGLQVKPEWVLGADDYLKYRRKFGA